MLSLRGDRPRRLLPDERPLLLVPRARRDYDRQRKVGRNSPGSILEPVGAEILDEHQGL